MHLLALRRHNKLNSFQYIFRRLISGGVGAYNRICFFLVGRWVSGRGEGVGLIGGGAYTWHFVVVIYLLFTLFLCQWLWTMHQSVFSNESSGPNCEDEERSSVQHCGLILELLWQILHFLIHWKERHLYALLHLQTTSGSQ